MVLHMKYEPIRSKEFDIDETVETLLGKLVSGAITPSEESQYQQLLVQRSRLMRTAVRSRRKHAA